MQIIGAKTIERMSKNYPDHKIVAIHNFKESFKNKNGWLKRLKSLFKRKEIIEDIPVVDNVVSLADWKAKKCS